MKKVLLLLSCVMTVSGCAHTSIHDYCVANAEHFSSYDECYKEEAEAHERDKSRKTTAAFFQGFSNGYNQSRSNRISCTSYRVGFTTQTRCQ